MDAFLDSELIDPAIDVAALRRPHAPFPYLTVRLMPAVYGICPLAAGQPRERLIALAQREHRARRGELKVCLVLGDTEALYIGFDGTPKQGDRPWGGRTVAWLLHANTAATSVAQH